VVNCHLRIILDELE